MTLRLLGLACGLLASPVLAHPGHGAAPAASWLHGLEPEHLAPLLLVAALVAAARRRSAARERRR
jgi:hypothetical protein